MVAAIMTRSICRHAGKANRWLSQLRGIVKLIVVTPAGRERYLRLLSHYVLGSSVVDEWQLWDNCRNEADKRYLRELAASDPRCKIKELPGADGGFRIIGDFFRFCDDADALYLRLDDDVVYAEPGFFEAFKERALAARGSALWFAPLIINNAVCGSLLKHFSKVRIDGPVTAQAMCPRAWAYASFPKALHPVFIDAVRRGRLDDFRVPDRELRMGRFSINAIAFFGSEIVQLGDRFIPPAGDEEVVLRHSSRQAGPMRQGVRRSPRFALQLLHPGKEAAANRHPGRILSARVPAAAQLRKAGR